MQNRIAVTAQIAPQNHQAKLNIRNFSGFAIAPTIPLCICKAYLTIRQRQFITE
jgi:hypothetical protein